MPAHDPERRVERSYGEAEIVEGLLAVYLAGGNTRLASRQTGIPHQTLYDWKDKHAQRYEELAAQHRPELEKRVVGKLEEAVVAGAAATLQAIEYASAAIEQADVKDAAKAAKDLAQATGTVTDKLLTLQGRPSQISQNQDASEILRALKQRVPWLVVDSTATEEPPYELEPGQNDPQHSASRPDSGTGHARTGN